MDSLLLRDVFVRDFSKYALNIHSKGSNSELQKELSLKIIKTPVVNNERFNKIWTDHVYAMKDQYKMND